MQKNSAGTGRPCENILPQLKTNPLFKRLIRKAVILAVVTVAVGYFYGRASPWAFPKRQTVGFGWGVLHGALMPLSLPSLVIGKDVQIYEPDNSGRTYKIGYICGVDLCGLVFFGPLFWRPKHGANHKNQPR
jgi:hypothetical protein